MFYFLRFDRRNWGNRLQGINRNISFFESTKREELYHSFGSYVTLVWENDLISCSVAKAINDPSSVFPAIMRHTLWRHNWMAHHHDYVTWHRYDFPYTSFPLELVFFLHPALPSLMIPDNHLSALIAIDFVKMFCSRHI